MRAVESSCLSCVQRGNGRLVLGSHYSPDSRLPSLSSYLRQGTEIRGFCDGHVPMNERLGIMATRLLAVLVLRYVWLMVEPRFYVLAYTVL